MTIADWIGALGVALLLVAYALHLRGRLAAHSAPYLLLNLLGAGLACLASVLIAYWPFVVLEAAWVLVSAHGLWRQWRA